MILDVPPDWALEAVLDATAFITRRCDIFESDGTTPWMLNAPITGGDVKVDAGSQEERRNFTIELTKTYPGLEFHIGWQGGLWYDKVIKLYRGVHTADGSQSYEAQLGEFLIDSIDADNFPSTVKVQGRDLSKKLLNDQFSRTTAFSEGSSLTVVLRSIAINGGINPDKIVLPNVNRTLGKDYVFEDGTARFKAMSDMATSFGYDLYFDAKGYLVMPEQKDPTTSPIDYVFKGGTVDGNLESWHKNVNDSMLYNHVVVKGEGAGINPVYGEVQNDNPSSPTNVDRIGRRTYRYTSKFISTEAQALQVAQNFLAVHSLEEYNVDMQAVALPWIEAGAVVEFHDPDPNYDQPVRYFLHDFNIPLGLDTMKINARRAELTG